MTLNLSQRGGGSNPQNSPRGYDSGFINRERIKRILLHLTKGPRLNGLVTSL